MKVGFAVSGKGRCAQFAIRNQRSLGFDVGPVLLGPRVDNQTRDNFSQLSQNVMQLSNDSARRDKELQDTFGDESLCQLWMLTFNHLIPAPAVAAREGQIINLHPSLLPAFPGLHGFRDALNSDVPLLGATCHFVDEGIDTGPIINQFVTSRLPRADYLTQEAGFAIGILGIYCQTLHWFVKNQLRLFNGSEVILEATDHQIAIPGLNILFSPGLDSTVIDLLSQIALDKMTH